MHRDVIAPDEDPRWALLAELAKRSGNDEPSAFGFTWPRPIGYYTGKAPRPIYEYVALRFDRRLSLTAVVAQLRAAWPELQRIGAVRERNRALGARKVELLRHVCLRHPNLSWRGRLEKWNGLQPRAWRYRTLEAFVTACHDAEDQLTGNRHGLAWFYDPIARTASPELKRRADDGDGEAVRELERRRVEGDRSIEAAGIQVIRYEKEVRRGKKRTR